MLSRAVLSTRIKATATSKTSILRAAASTGHSNSNVKVTLNPERLRSYKESIENPEKHWDAAARDIDWFGKYSQVLDTSNSPFNKWFVGGKMNTSYNCLDRHVLNGRGDQVAVIYDSPVTGVLRKYTYNELLKKVSRLATVLQNQGLKKGDTVVIYMPNTPQAVTAMLACARLGVVHSVVFGGFSSHELAVRFKDSKPKMVISSSCGIDGSKVIPYKPLLDAALKISEEAGHVIPKTLIYQRDQHKAEMVAGRDLDWAEEMANVEKSPILPAVAVDSSDPLYILYTSGTTGAPKGVLRENGGHAVGVRWSMKNVYNAKPGDVFWAASDVGWVVGHSYITYGPLLTGCTSVIYEGKPVGTPDAVNFWRTIERHNVNIFYTAPTAVRAIKRLDRSGEQAEKFSMPSLRSTFLVGEHADVDTVQWTERVTGKPVIDHWWQTETGWPICANEVGIEGFIPIKHGSCFKAVHGYNLQVLDDDHKPVPPGTMGNLAIKLPLPPGSFATLYNNEQRFVDSYMKKIPGFYDTGDAGIIDEDGYVYVMSRTDDVINVAGHRLSTGAMEEVLSDHPDIAECAVIGVKDSFRGQVPLGLMIVNANCTKDEATLAEEVVQMVRERIGPVAFFKKAVIVQKLPKTRSGKILRGILRKIANHETYAMPAAIEDPTALDEAEKVIRAHEEH